MPDRTSPRTAVVLIQLGTPAAPTSSALRRYLAEFLSDKRVVDMPRYKWLPILHGIVLRTRPKRSAALYAKVWTEAGSPLRTITEAQTERARTALATTACPPVAIAYAMRYGQPSIQSVVDRLCAQGIDQLLAFPLYPQYASATTGSVCEELFRALGRQRYVPALTVVPPFYDHPGYIDALTTTVEKTLAGLDWQPQKILVSFHGIPRAQADAGDPYPQHVGITSSLLRHRLHKRLGIDPGAVLQSFQSRFGRAEWLQPYTDSTLEELAEAGVRRILAICPGFTTDCLETTDEIGREAKETFLAAGGDNFALVPCLNDHPFFTTLVETTLEASFLKR